MYRRRVYRRPTKRRRVARSLKYRRRQIGERIGTSSSKSALITDNNSSVLDGRVLYYHGCIAVQHGNQRNQRERNIINVRGIRNQMLISTDATAPVFVNIALISIKNWDGWDGEGIGPSSANFFRNYEEQRGTDFSIALNSLKFHYNAINTDNFVVLKHKRYLLDNPGQSAFKEPNRPSYRAINWYTPLRRQVRFENDGDVIPTDGQVFLVYWCDLFQAGDNQIAVQDILKIQERTILYFKDPKV